ncbi:hypothetical protein [Phocaeicola massiliensis]|jgi:hypothetical protein|nr:hypothetical protein [Phocaeicola massiliensis]
MLGVFSNSGSFISGSLGLFMPDKYLRNNVKSMGNRALRSC